MGTNSTHYHSISIISDIEEDVYPDNIVIYGKTDSETAYATPETFELIHKPIEAVITSDDFDTWDYNEEDEIDPFTVWSADGTALGTYDVTIKYCYANIALEIKPITRDGVVYYPTTVGAVSVANVWSVTVDEETEEDIYTYYGTSVNKYIPAELDDSTYIVTVPHINVFTSSGSGVPDDYRVVQEEFIIIIYEDEDTNAIQKIQPIYYEQYEE